MEQELYLDLRKGKPQTLEKLVRENLGRTWFLCGEMTMDSAMAVPLLLASWERALARCREAQSAPGGSFLELVGEEVLRLYLGGVEPDGDWEGLPPPQLPAKYRLCLQELRDVSLDRRPVYLAQVIGGGGDQGPGGEYRLPPGGGGRAHQAGGAGRDRVPRLDGQDPAGRLGAAVHRF